MKCHKTLLQILIVLFLSSFGSKELVAQISGTLYNENGEQLPFASIYIDGTNQGTFSNEEGFYELKLKAGENTIVYKYVGYASERIRVHNEGKRIEKNLVLKGDNIVLNTVIIKPEEEDPAYAIIRKAIKARKQFRDQPTHYKSRIYQKTQFELLDVPEKIMGISIASDEEDKNEIAELLDTNSNVIFVSESVSDFFKGSKDQSKEIIISSRISGDQSSYNTLSSELSKLDFYQNSLLLGRSMVSPIASNSMLFYDYKLLGSFMDENAKLVNKIKVIPIRRHDPVFKGIVFIVEDYWNLHSLDLSTSSDNTNVMMIDSIAVKQHFQKVDTQKNIWALASQYATINIDFFGLRAKGFHAKNNLDYSLNQEYSENFFDKIILEVERESNKRDSIYWNKIRPIPLSLKEEKAYHKMDSLEIVTSSKSYLDSMDRKWNRFSMGDLIGSYTYVNSYKNYIFEISSPLLKTRFNPIQGFNTKIDFSFTKKLERKQNVKLQVELDYGFADNGLNPLISWNHLVNKQNMLAYNIAVGRKLVQPGEQEIMSRFINSLTSLIQVKNYLHLYQKDFIEIKLSRHFIPGINGDINLEYSYRSGVPNHSSYSFKEEGDFSPNIFEEGEELLYRNKLNIAFLLSYRPGTKYIALPDELSKIYSSKPLFYLEYDKALGISKDFVNYDFIKGGIKGGFSGGFWGYSNYQVEGGTYLSAKRVDVIDDRYFIGNDRHYVKNYKFRDAFQLLPYYHSANNKAYVIMRFDHFLNGLIMSKIPLIRKLKVEEVLNINVLFLEEEKPFYELGLGINGLFRFANLRYSWGFYGREFYDKRFTFSFSFPFL